MKRIEDFDLSDLKEFPHIYDFVRKNWCSVRLKIFLEELMHDTRQGGRRGFPTTVSNLLFTLSLENINALEEIGVQFDDLLDDNGFGNTKWDLPPNF